MRARLVPRGFWLDERTALLSPMERLVWLGLYAAADREGRLEYRPLALRAQMFPYGGPDIDLDSAVRALETAGALVRYEVEDRQLIYLPDFCKTQRPHRNESPSRLPPPPRSTSAPREDPGAAHGLAEDVPMVDRGPTMVPGNGSPGSITVAAPEGATMDGPGTGRVERELPADAIRLAVLLGDLMRQNDSLAKVPRNLRRWAEELEQLHRLDGRSWEDIERIMRWSQRDEFWRTNILSAGKLRKQFPQLALKAGSITGADAWQDAREVVP